MRYILLLALCSCTPAMVDSFHRAQHMPDNSIDYSAPNTVYNAEQCIGAVVNGVCNGTISPDASYHPSCHGEWVGGQCTGPLF